MTPVGALRSGRFVRELHARGARVVATLALCAVGVACAPDEPAVTVVTGGPSSAVAAAGASAVSDPSGPSAVVADPSGVTFAPGDAPSGAVSTTAPLPGPFRTITVHLTRPDGTAFDWCLLLADTEPLREQGLMGVTDLAGYPGMLFAFGGDQNVGFWMKETVVPLSIAFFRADGRFVSATDMSPCAPDASAVCPLYPAAAPYADAIETTLGRLASAGVTDGATVTLGETGCRPS